MSSALEGIIVVDLTTEFWASLSAAMLGDFGAEVIRVDTLPQKGNSVSKDWNYEADLANRNKKSLALDLSSDKGLEVLRELIARCDIFLTDQSLAYLQEAGLDYGSLSEEHTGLIYTRGSGFGPEGPDHDLPPIDELAAARTGMMPILPQPGEPPVYPGHGMMYTTIMLAFGAVTALLHRNTTGEGQQVDSSLFAGNMYAASLDLQAFLSMGGDRFLQPLSRLDAGNPMSGTLYPSQDGRWVTLTMPDTDRWWPDFSAAVGIDQDDDRFNTHEKRCDVNRLELMEVLEKAFQQQPGSHWRQVFAEKQMSADVIEAYSYPADDRQAKVNRYVIDIDHPSLGQVQSLGFPIFMSESPGRLDRLAPGCGQHSAQVLHDTLGYSVDRIQQLKEDGVLA